MQKILPAPAPAATRRPGGAGDALTAGESLTQVAKQRTPWSRAGRSCQRSGRLRVGAGRH